MKKFLLGLLVIVFALCLISAPGAKAKSFDPVTSNSQTFKDPLQIAIAKTIETLEIDVYGPQNIESWKEGVKEKFGWDIISAAVDFNFKSFDKVSEEMLWANVLLTVTVIAKDNDGGFHWIVAKADLVYAYCLIHQKLEGVEALDKDFKKGDGKVPGSTPI